MPIKRPNLILRTLITFSLLIHKKSSVEIWLAANCMILDVSTFIQLEIFRCKIHILGKWQQRKMKIMDIMILCAFNAKILMGPLSNMIIGPFNSLLIVLQHLVELRHPSQIKMFYTSIQQIYLKSRARIQISLSILILLSAELSPAAHYMIKDAPQVILLGMFKSIHQLGK